MVKKVTKRTSQPQPLSCHVDAPQPLTLKRRAVRKLATQRVRSIHSMHRLKRQRFEERVLSGQFGNSIDETRLQCPICLQLLVLPRSLACGHIFCQRCLESNSAHTQVCCMCRRETSSEPVLATPVLQNLINRCIVAKTDAITYLCRVTDAQQWLHWRKVNQVKTGMMVDYQDQPNLWRPALIIQTIHEAGTTFIHLRLLTKAVQFRRFVNASSKKLAPYLFFSKNIYLQDFGPGLMDKFQNYEQIQQEWKNNNQGQRNIQDFLNLDQSAQQYEERDREFHDSPIQSENSLDQALVLFNHEIEANDFIF